MKDNEKQELTKDQELLELTKVIEVDDLKTLSECFVNAHERFIYEPAIRTKLIETELKLVKVIAFLIEKNKRDER